ncbi:MAG: hypothetical protein PHW10_00600 [Candidatus Peribacteraceae bacterium]|nr:hypothetical protein [Candidatus Peribacteraceae bacterium]
MAGAFLVGIQSAGEVHPVGRSEAQQANLLSGAPATGDINADGSTDLQDAIALVTFLQTDSEADDVPDADLDGDGTLTLDDLLALLRAVSRQ